MAGVNISESCHIVNCLPPINVDTANGASCVTVNMANYAHCTFIVQTGVTDAVPGTLTVEEKTGVAAGDVAIGFTYYMEDTNAGDVLGPRVTVGVGGVALSANDNTIYLIEVDAAQLSDGSNYIQLEWSNPGGNTFGSVIAVLSGARYANPESPTAIV